MEVEPQEAVSCPLCRGTKCLTQWGVFIIYPWARPISFLLVLVGLFLGLIQGSLWFLLAGGGMVIPLADADLRLALYPYVALSHLLGRKVNCPRCEPFGGIFRHI